jgi:hypothetical protein
VHSVDYLCSNIVLVNTQNAAAVVDDDDDKGSIQNMAKHLKYGAKLKTRTLLHRPTVAQQVEKCPYYSKFNTAFTVSLHWTLPHAI